MSKKNADTEALEHESLDHTVDNINETEIATPSDSPVIDVGTEPGETDAGLGLNDLENIAAVPADENVGPTDPRVEARDVVHTENTASAAQRVAASGYGVESTMSEEELIKSVPASPAAGQPLDVVAYEEYTAEVAAQNAESAAAAMKLSSIDRARRVQALQRVGAKNYEANS